jgi:hypothetical protein
MFGGAFAKGLSWTASPSIRYTVPSVSAPVSAVGITTDDSRVVMVGWVDKEIIGML